MLLGYSLYSFIVSNPGGILCINIHELFVLILEHRIYGGQGTGSGLLLFRQKMWNKLCIVVNFVLIMVFNIRRWCCDSGNVLKWKLPSVFVCGLKIFNHTMMTGNLAIDFIMAKSLEIVFYTGGKLEIRDFPNGN